MTDDLDISEVSALVETEGSAVEEKSAIQALLRNKSGTPIIPFVNMANENQEGIVKPDGVTTFVDSNGVISAQNGSTSLPLGTAVYLDSLLGFDETKGYAPAGTYVYKDAVEGSRYGYPTFIDEWFKQFDNAAEQNMVIADVSITTRVHSNGRIFYDIADKSAIDDLYEACGVADMWGVDKENNRIFTPRNDWFIQGCSSVDDVNAFNEAGLPNITGSFGDKDQNWQSGTGGATGAFQTVRHSANSAGGEYAARDTGFTFDASRSSSVYGNSSTVQPKSSNKLLYYIVGNTETKTAVTNVIDITTTENDTIPLLHHIPADEELDHPSWIRSYGQWNDGSAYTTVYSYLVNEYEYGTSHTDTIADSDGTVYTVDYKTINGKKVVDYTNVQQVDNLYNALGSAWYYVIDRDNMTFRLPQSNNEFYLYFKVANAVQNLELLDVGKVMERAVMRADLAEAAVVVETYQNGSSRYRIWSDGWCEQYTIAVPSAGSTYTWSFLKPFKDTNYVSFAQDLDSLNTTATYYKMHNKTTSSVQVKSVYTSGAISVQLLACGYIE